MEKIGGNFYDVYLLSKRKTYVELLICETDGQSVLIVDINLEDDCVFKYISCSNFVYANKEMYDKEINEAIEKLKKGEEK